MAILNWIWPPGRCHNCQSIYSSSLTNDIPNIKQIHRSSDGKFKVDEDAVDGILVESKRNSIGSQYSSSDDGGFLPRRARIPCPTWRRPLVQWPSELSFRSDGGHSSNRWINLGRNLLQTIPQIHRAPTSPHPVPVTQNLHINTVSASVPIPMISHNNVYTPSRISRIMASSPANSSPMVNSPWSPLYFSDLSSVQPSSAERSTHSFNNNRSFRPSRNPRYINELPALRTLHEETDRVEQRFVPVQFPSPPVRSYYANIGPQPLPPFHRRSRTLPRSMRHHPPELTSPLLNLNLNIIEQSPESHSSSSGFGSKNTSSQQNQSSNSGGPAHDWRLPPYRLPPQPRSTSTTLLQKYHHDSLINSPSSPYSMSTWFEVMQRLNLASEFKAVDVGSVDGCYEFDPSTPTPPISTPTGRDELLQQHLNHHHHQTTTLQQQQHHHHHHPNDPFATNFRNKRERASLQLPRYDQATIDARVQAMKEEFYAYRKRQAIKRAGIVLESAC
jgi:immunoglobulin superfamily member 9B